MRKLVLLRHGESIWNRDNIFTGWTDIDLSEKGIEEAREAGLLLKKEGFVFDAAFTSVLKRAIRTLWIVLDELDLMWIPIYHSWRLNERHYGALQGLNKSETTQKYGEEQVFLWRRSYSIVPPLLERTDERYPEHDLRYRNLSAHEIPAGESLNDVISRLLPYWHDTISPLVKSGRRVLVSAHGNSIRALVKYLSNISDDEIPRVNIPTGIPLIYELDDNLNAVRNYYLGDPEIVRQAARKISDQGTING